MTEDDYLESYIGAYNQQIKDEKDEAQRIKERYGTFTIDEILNAMEDILNG